ncbi:MAG: zinc-binding dehydrogenase [Solirubrobacteraceae bacterium]
MAARRTLPVGGGPRDPRWFRQDFAALLELLRQGKIHPVVAERLPLADARRAHELLQSSAGNGKLVLVPSTNQVAARWRSTSKITPQTKLPKLAHVRDRRCR